jgi:hypothetical protein
MRADARVPEHDPENGRRFSEKVVLEQKDERRVRFGITGSGLGEEKLMPIFRGSRQ